jgi:N-acetylglutamate synthase/N-acetylornithine aminotransferase
LSLPTNQTTIKNNEIIIIIIINNRANAVTGDIGTINSNDGIAATMYSLGIWFVSGIYV